MSDLNKLDNISNMSDEELDVFIKSELNSSLMEDIKVDEELINKTMQAVEKTEIDRDLGVDNEAVTFNNKKSGPKIRRFIPILSMAACTCIIVMAGSLVYSQIGKNKSDNASVSDKGVVSEMEESKSESLFDEGESVDGTVDKDSILNNVVGDKGDINYSEDFDSETSDEAIPDKNEVTDEMKDPQEESPELPQQDESDDKGVLQDISRLLIKIWRTYIKNILK